MKQAKLIHAAIIFVVGMMIVGTVAVAGVARLEIVGYDDWPADSTLDPGEMWCAGSELTMANPVTPVCEQTGQLKSRDAMAYACVGASDTDGVPVPEFSGVAVYVLNANFDATYSGPVWGTWLTVPADACDKELLAEPEVYWQGTFVGKRTRVCEGEQCMWVGNLKLVGRGHGGDLEGRRFKGTETVVTYSPAPLPYELMGICTPPACPPEGVVTGVIKK